MGLRPQIHKAPPLAHSARLSDLVSERSEAFEVCVHRFCPIRDMLESFTPGLEEVTIHRRGIIVLLNQLDLQGARISQGDAESGGRRLPAVAEVVNLHVFKIKKWAYPKHGRPVTEGGGKVSHDVAVLPNLTKNATHAAPPFKNVVHLITPMPQPGMGSFVRTRGFRVAGNQKNAASEFCVHVVLLDRYRVHC